jgi:hypothetical protein
MQNLCENEKMAIEIGKIYTVKSLEEQYEWCGSMKDSDGSIVSVWKGRGTNNDIRYVFQPCSYIGYVSRGERKLNGQGGI